jgi:hypothetical protein
VSELTSLNPALVVISVIALYVIILFLRHNLGWIILGAWTVLCLSLLFLPGGSATLNQAHLLPGIIPRVECAYTSVITRTPWRAGASAKTIPLCRFRGDGVDVIADTGAAATDIANVKGDLLRAYGR